MTVPIGDRSESLRHAMVADLVAKGVIRSEAWRRAFEHVPRHVLVPRFYDDERASEPVVVADDPDRSMPRVYQDEVLVIERDTYGEMTSSSSKPSMMAAFLDALDIEDGNAVLEIGTGTGYNAALLCERLVSDLVTTIDITAALVEEAGARLADCGYTPTIAVADGRQGYPARAPYDRIVATCSVERIPTAWLRQLRPGGVVVTPLRGDRFLAGLVALRRQPDGSLVGRLRRELATFMPLRHPAGEETTPARFSRAELRAKLASADGGTRPCTVPPWLTLGPDTFNAGLLFRLHAPDTGCFWRRAGGEWGPYVDEQDRDGVAVASRQDGSWARTTFRGEGATVTQGGPRRLWDLVEECWQLYVRCGRPGTERYGMTVRPDGRQFVWLDDPRSAHRWEV